MADHIRAITHLIADGVFPGNGGRGYVLRRLIRRAVSHGRQIGINRPFLASCRGEVVAQMKDFYPLLAEKSKLIADVIREEEDHFFATLEQGLKWFEEIFIRHEQDKLITGAEAFKLHDTYGFPIELTVELARRRAAGSTGKVLKKRWRAARAGAPDRAGERQEADLLRRST